MDMVHKQKHHTDYMAVSVFFSFSDELGQVVSATSLCQVKHPSFSIGKSTYTNHIVSCEIVYLWLKYVLKSYKWLSAQLRSLCMQVSEVYCLYLLTV